MRYQGIAAILATASTASSQSTGDWATAYDKANAALAKLSSQDKINIVTGVGWNKGPCDSPLGIRYGNGVTAFTPGIQAGSTWDRDLMRQRGQFMGEEARGCGVHVLLGPVAGPLGKIAQGGRNWEGFAADPYLSGIATAETVEGMQAAGVQANVKHYIANEQELNRDTISSNVDDRTMHELYLWPFADAVKANVASVMCAYNKLNGTWSCEDDKSLNGLLKKELGFQGYVMTDWNAQHSTEQSANAGLDMTMPGSDYNGGSVLWGPKLQSAVSSGRVPQSRVDDMVRRILGAWYLTNQNSGYPTININANVQGNHKTNVRAIARDGIVLLRNEGNTLPLKKPSRLALIGSAAANNPQGINACVDRGCNTGALGMGWGSGTANYPYFVAPADAIRTRAQTDGTTITLQASDSTSAASAARGADAAIVFITADSGEGYITVEGHAGDRNNLDPWHSGNALVQAVAQANENVIVVVHSVGPILLETILALPQVKAVVWAGLPSQESGNALVDVLYGATSPSGKLPYTIANAAGDYGTSVSRGQSDSFSEGLYIDYRHFDRANIAPRYEFGFGLSYTNFTYSAIAVDGAPKSGPATGAIVSGGRADLFETVATVTVTVANSGGVAGAEVAQLYVGYPSSVTAPPRQLRGFEKLPLAAGASGTATFALRRRDLSYWDVARQNWVVPTGAFTISVSASSRDIRQTATLTVS
ncbi:hypothetical protein PG984_009802 [Apiospora sp. TS-2023a]